MDFLFVTLLCADVGISWVHVCFMLHVQYTHAEEYYQEVRAQSHEGSNNFGRVNIIHKATSQGFLIRYVFASCEAVSVVPPSAALI